MEKMKFNIMYRGKNQINFQLLENIDEYRADWKTGKDPEVSLRYYLDSWKVSGTLIAGEYYGYYTNEETGEQLSSSEVITVESNVFMKKGNEIIVFNSRWCNDITITPDAEWGTREKKDFDSLINDGWKEIEYEEALRQIETTGNVVYQYSYL